MMIDDRRFLDHLASAGEMVSARRYREAEVDVLRALSIAPSELRALKLLALVRFKLGRLEEARAVCREIAATVPRDPQIRLKLGLIALRLERFEESVQELEIAARLAPEDLRAWSYLGYAYARQGQNTRAAAAFRRAGQDGLAATVESLDGGGAEGNGAGLHPPASDEPPHPAPEGVVHATGRTLPEPQFDLSAPMAARETATGLFARAGAAPVLPLVTYAVSRLAPPSGQASWVGAAARLAVAGEAFVRADAAVALTGEVRWEAAHRRARGRTTDQPLGIGALPFFRLAGSGELLVAAPPGGRLVSLALEDDIFYVRADRVLAFEGTVSWEHGQVPRTSLELLQFRGRGLVALSVAGETGALKVAPERPAFVSAARLLGWIGRVVARGLDDPAGAGAGAATAAPFDVVCEGEGVVVVDVEVREGGR